METRTADPKADPETRATALERARTDQQLALTELADEPDGEPEEDQAPRKRKKPKSATALTKALCTKRGWLTATVEQRIPHTFITRDMFGFIDMVALDDQPGLLGIQATGGASGVAHQRLRKIVSPECEPAARRWLQAGLRLEVWHWRPTNKGVRGAKKTMALRRFVLELSAPAGEITWSVAEDPS